MYPKAVNIDERNIARLTDLYQSVYKEILGEIKTASGFGIANRKAILSQIRSALIELGVDVNDIIDKQLSTSYTSGATDAVEQLKHVGAPISVSEGFNRIHKEAVAALIDDTSRSFGESLNGVNRSATRMLSLGAREQITQRMASGMIGGKALREVKNNIVGIIQNEGLEALVDKGGRKWKLDRYAEMLIRTKATEARNRGLANRLVENQYDLVQVSAHGATDQCGPWEGAILSVTGDTPGYHTVMQAEEGGLFHPNCRHAINALVPNLAKITEAYNPNVDTLTGNEFIDQVDEELKGLVKPDVQVVRPKS